jgi:hypothetical protein
MDLDTFKRQIIELEERFQQWIDPIDRTYSETIYKVNKDGYTLDDHKREVKEIAQSQIAQYDPYQDMYALLDQVCPIYLGASPQRRAEIRAAVSDKEGIRSGLINYVYRAAEQLQSPADKEWLRLGLAAVSIENGSMDIRDTLVALAELFVAAEKAGIDPKPYFREVAELSSISINETLSGFHSYAVLEERRSRTEGWGEKDAPWERRIYHLHEIGKYAEEGDKESIRRDERNPWWRRMFGISK